MVSSSSLRGEITSGERGVNSRRTKVMKCRSPLKPYVGKGHMALDIKLSICFILGRKGLEFSKILNAEVSK
jgi:hypothetical protein